MTKITNRLNGAGTVLCMVCQRGTIWWNPRQPRQPAWTSPMVKFKNHRADGLVHRCCESKAKEMFK